MNFHVFLIIAEFTSISIHLIFLTYSSASGKSMPQTNAHEPLQNAVRGVGHLHQGEPFILKQL